MWTGSIGSECEQLADSCEHCNEPVRMINLENLTSWECIRFFWRALFHGISSLFIWVTCCTGFVNAVAIKYCIHSNVLPTIKIWRCCICSAFKEMLSCFLWLRTYIIEVINVSLHKYSSGILNCGQHSLIENHGFLPGTNCSNLASILCLTCWPEYVPSTYIILSMFINTQGYGSLIGVLCLLDFLSDWQGSVGIGWCVFRGITAVTRVVIFSSKYINLLKHSGYCLYHCCNIQELLPFASTVYLLSFNWHAVKYCQFFVCVLVCICAWD